MSTRFSFLLSDELNRSVDGVAKEANMDKDEILLKALRLFLVAREGSNKGLKLGLFDPRNELIQIEIIGL